MICVSWDRLLYIILRNSEIRAKVRVLLSVASVGLTCIIIILVIYNDIA